MPVGVRQCSIWSDIDNPARLIEPTTPFVFASKRIAHTTVPLWLLVHFHARLLTTWASTGCVERGIRHLVGQSFEHVEHTGSVMEKVLD